MRYRKVKFIWEQEVSGGDKKDPVPQTQWIQWKVAVGTAIEVLNYSGKRKSS